MTMTELLIAVKECLDITSKDISIKLSYQYPEWIAMGDGELDTPQYITDDTEVGGEDGGDNCMDEEEWHAFALSETPLTIPPTQKNVGGKDQEVSECSVQRPRNGMPWRQTILHGMRGIEIREPAENSQLAMAETEARQKGKNNPLEDETDSYTDSDEALVVPVLRTSIPESANASRPVARRLVFGIPGIPNTQEEDGSSSSSTEAPLEVADEFGQHWGKFDEALHEMLNNPYTPALFGKDAPPVFNDRRGT
ncbi:hypothetical protein F2Q70_00003049 [Brassica cretica]|uniref:Uncharacterized protein n=1 Tax=Brassica cretica TaxID=69181 RepID=A0A8S9IPP5_BRACR|nr:hypothetical protein F2Q70_00003049 [Brassica cretica]